MRLLLKGSCQLTPAFPGTQAHGELIIDSSEVVHGQAPAS